MDPNKKNEEVAGVTFESRRSVSDKPLYGTALPETGSNLFEFNFPAFKKYLSPTTVYWTIFLLISIFTTAKILSFINLFAKETSSYQESIISQMKGD